MFKLTIMQTRTQKTFEVNAYLCLHLGKIILMLGCKTIVFKFILTIIIGIYKPNQ